MRSIVERMPAQASKIDDLTEELLHLGGRYRRYLHQDELGPTRAERMAALRELIKQFDLLSVALIRLPQSLWRKLSSALATDDFNPFPTAGGHYLNDKPVVRRIAFAAERISVDINIEKRPGNAELVERLAHEANKTGDLLEGLDTTTEADICVNGPALVGRRLRTEDRQIHSPTPALASRACDNARWRYLSPWNKKEAPNLRFHCPLWWGSYANCGSAKPGHGSPGIASAIVGTG